MTSGLDPDISRQLDVTNLERAWSVGAASGPSNIIFPLAGVVRAVGAAVCKNGVKNQNSHLTLKLLMLKVAAAEMGTQEGHKEAELFCPTEEEVERWMNTAFDMVSTFVRPISQ